MHSLVLWPFLTVAASAVALVPTVEDSGHRSLLFWLIIPPLLAGVVTVCTRIGVW